MELPTPAADSAVVPAPQTMETTPTMLADSKKESPSSGPAPAVPVMKEKQQEASGASSTNVNGRVHPPHTHLPKIP